jgi:hypothetical protein
MKKLLISIGVLLCLNANAQWTNKTINNGFDDPYRICYTATNNLGYLKLENVDGQIYFYLNGKYCCDDSPVVNLSFIVNGVTVKYYCTANVGDNKDVVWILEDFLNSAVVESFKNCSTLNIRVNDTVCNEEIYSFNMSGSTAALNFIIGK